ncbi:hypothetical protein HMPREF0372_04049 [Flavonifractor plautii ATCC 29863]|uniref:Uncharacterized protein n=1 Tax=Flavonifractor plautii ATCC 29863 TaxID=411475 RepID=G9YWY1_FLAPL|nr:hypothetical protein HMPREF0372_04049 [Flavonifractor plautii ATCC 29863]
MGGAARSRPGRPRRPGIYFRQGSPARDSLFEIWRREGGGLD